MGIGMGVLDIVIRNWDWGFGIKISISEFGV